MSPKKKVKKNKFISDPGMYRVTVLVHLCQSTSHHHSSIMIAAQIVAADATKKLCI
jgi:hypothetical protein